MIGDEVWRSGDGLDITVRIAVHSVRRIAQGTVLDWSVTPLSGPGLRPHDAIPASLNLGLSRFGEGQANIFLVDGVAKKVYRPLTYRGPSQPQTCLCTPIWLAQRNLRLGETLLLQLAFPELPKTLRTIDVDVTTVPMFSRAPITPEGNFTVATSPVDLARPPHLRPEAGRTEAFRFAPGDQMFTIAVDRVVMSSTNTSLQWTIRSLSTGEGLEVASRPPFAARPDDGGRKQPPSFNPVSASGPQLVPVNGSRRAAVSAKMITTRLQDKGAQECLCSDLRLWAASLQRAGQQVSVVTNLGPLSRSTTRVDVVFPGLPAITAVKVVPARDGSTRASAPRSAEAGTWFAGTGDLPFGWLSLRWPTPTPSPTQLELYQATVDAIL